MTQRNNHPQMSQSMPSGIGGSLRVALAPLAVYSFVLVSLITVLPGAGFGNV